MDRADHLSQIAIPWGNIAGDFSTCYIVSPSSKKMQSEKLFRLHMRKKVARSIGLKETGHL